MNNFYTIQKWHAVAMSAVDSKTQQYCASVIRAIRHCYIACELFQTVCALEEKVRSLDDQLRVLHDQRNAAEQQSRRAELDVRDMQERLRKADREINNADVYRDGLRSDKENVSNNYIARRGVRIDKCQHYRLTNVTCQHLPLDANTIYMQYSMS